MMHHPCGKLAIPTLCASWLLTSVCVAFEPTPENSKIPVQHFDPQPIQLTVDQLPPPGKDSADKHPQVVPPPSGAKLKVPAGFTVNVFADDVQQARWLALTPDGDVLCSSGRTNDIYLLKDANADGVAEERSLFLDEKRGANLPFGMTFARDGDEWYFFVANTDGVLRYPYKQGQTELGSKFKKITDLPGEGYNQHWTRNVRVTPSGDKLFVTVGSKTNVDQEGPPRASVLRMNLDGSERVVFGSGLRNPVGLDFHPVTGEVYVTVNERDKIGDDLVPDYLTRVREGEFFGWPYAYLTPKNLDPRRSKNGRSEKPELAAKTVTPDVLFQAHSAALGLAFSTTEKFPAKYHNGAFAAFRGSWNRSEGTGYKLVFVPFDGSNRPEGHYEDFLTGFLVEPKKPATWGRPVGLVFAKDGSLLFTEEGNSRIYRVSYSGS